MLFHVQAEHHPFDMLDVEVQRPEQRCVDGHAP
jgi:hypothetical protein